MFNQSVKAIKVVFLIFQEKQSKFREMFRVTTPLNYNAVCPYISLEKVGV